MATNLQTWLAGQDPNQSNVFIDFLGGAIVNSGDNVDFSNGSDVILAVGKDGGPGNPGTSGETGLKIVGTLNMGNGVDAVIGVGGNGGFGNPSLLSGKNGGNAGDGIGITGMLDLGNGGDIAVGLDQVPLFPGLKGTGGAGGIGLTGGGTGGKGGNGISIEGATATLLAGNGDDQILGVGGVGGNGGADVDLIGSGIGNGGAGGNGGNGIKISNGAQVFTGNGNDTITGIGGQGGQGGSKGTGGTNGVDGTNGFGIFNSTIGGSIGTGITKYGIDTSNGDDTIRASQGGFGGGGAINLGKGDDRVFGFGAQVIEAGQGFDVLDLGAGSFTSTAAVNGWTKISSGGVDMFARGFESIIGL